MRVAGSPGAAAALALARGGWSVTVVERAEALTEVGAGLQMSPNACRALASLGVLEAVRAGASVPEAALLRDGRTGRVIYRAALGQAAEARWGAPYLHVHRADLLAALVDAARAAGAGIRLGCKLRHALDMPGGVALHLEDGERLEGDLALGADGIRSVLRAQLNEKERPRYAGEVAWRGLIPAGALPEELVPRAATVWAGAGRHLVIYPLRGGQQVNFVAVEERPEADHAGIGEGWVAPGDPDRLRAGYEGWHPEARLVLDGVTETFQWALFDRPEQVIWTKGAIALIGDAAHPMLPFMAQGAAMALEDAVVLARVLAGPERSVAEGLAAYETARWNRVTRVQDRARANGRLFHRRTALGRLLHHGPVSLVSRLAPGFAAGRLDWLYGHDAAA